MAGQAVSKKSGTKPVLKTVFLFALLAVIFFVPVVFLNTLAVQNLKRHLPFEFTGQMQFSLPGTLIVSNFDVREKAFRMQAETIVLGYRPLEFLTSGRMQLELEGKNFVLSPEDMFLKPVLSGFVFDSVTSRLNLKESGGVEIDDFFASGKEAMIYMAGRVSKPELSVSISCFLTSELTKKLPDFLQEHLFLNRDAELKQLRFQAEGSWERPQFNVSSDLVRLEVKSRDNA